MHNAQPDFIAYIIAAAVVVLLLSFRLRSVPPESKHRQQEISGGPSVRGL